MPIKYVGRVTSYRGKPLWEYLYNLKDFGVGRIAVRSMFDRYPEPCYYKIVKVETGQMDAEYKSGKVWAEIVFRGIKYPEPQVLSTAYKSDFRLLRREEEKLYTERSFTPLPLVTVPKYGTFPPLLKEFILRDMKARGELTDKEPLLKMIYNTGMRNRIRIAEEGEPPFKEHLVGKLYEDVMDAAEAK